MMPTKKTKIIFIFSLVFFVFILFCFIACYFLIRSRNDDTLIKDGEIREEIVRNESYSLMKKDLDKIDEYKDTFYSYLIKDDEVADFIKSLENIALSNDLKSEIKQVAIEKIDNITISNIELLIMKINVSGEWKNVSYFLKVLENFPLKLDIKSISFNKFSDYELRNRIVPQWVGSFEFSVLKTKATN